MTRSTPFVIVVGIDGSEQSRAALEWAITEARLRQARLHLVTAWYYPPMASTVGDGVFDDTFRRASERTLADAVATVTQAGIPVTGDVEENTPAAALLDAASAADLVIVGSRGHGGFAGLLLGSVSAQLVHHAPCPVLVVRPRGF